ncbi:hypothetical protein HELRODRAFT_194207 [Helobdella robusta]|uniref:Tetraspanin n=1 Tax=Helobdella robusta TaxID=6412 RepID=T1FVT1_HELRO|nr:hypothetical protein HELRODRAFT_194207 [Helobdella robusta]ESN92486.1 hypothetical protein HELRODRAFT_194207 [Helobdella robusta]
MGCSKIILTIVNIILMLVGLIPLIIGIVVMAKPDAVKFVLEKILSGSLGSVDSSHLGDLLTTIKTGAWILIILGAVITIVAFFGCCGACCENKVFLILYVVVLVVVILGEITFLILAVVYPAKIDEPVKEYMHKSLKKFGSDYPVDEELREPSKSFTLIWHITQVSMRCCAVESYIEYKNVTFISDKGHAVPVTCCKKKSNNPQDESDYLDKEKCFNGDTEYINDRSCFKAFQDEISKYKGYIIGGIVGVIVVEILLLAMAIYIMKSSSDKYA